MYQARARPHFSHAASTRFSVMLGARAHLSVADGNGGWGDSMRFLPATGRGRVSYGGGLRPRGLRRSAPRSREHGPTSRAEVPLVRGNGCVDCVSATRHSYVVDCLAVSANVADTQSSGWNLGLDHRLYPRRERVVTAPQLDMVREVHEIEPPVAGHDSVPVDDPRQAPSVDQCVRRVQVQAHDVRPGH